MGSREDPLGFYNSLVQRPWWPRVEAVAWSDAESENQAREAVDGIQDELGVQESGVITRSATELGRDWAYLL